MALNSTIVTDTLITSTSTTILSDVAATFTTNSPIFTPSPIVHQQQPQAFTMQMPQPISMSQMQQPHASNMHYNMQPTPQPMTYPSYHIPVKLTLPNFTPNDPQLWFIAVEEQFSLHQIVDENTKYSNIVTALPPEISTAVRDIITHKPPHNPFSTLKQLILERLGSTLNERIKKLLGDVSLGDRRPSQMLVQMQGLVTEGSGITHNGAFIRTLFLQKLPQNVQTVLAATEDHTSLQALAKIADRVISVTGNPSVHAINHVTPSIPF